MPKSFMRSTPDFHSVPNYSNKSCIVNNPVTFDKFHFCKFKNFTSTIKTIKPVILNMVK